MESSCISLDFHFKRDGGAGGYFFLPAACFAAVAACFLAAAALVLAFFWPDFFWFAFGDLSPMMFWLSLTAVDSPAEYKFPRRQRHHAWWNGGCK